jgi:4-hydroxythreonine-4-phosphate dehydrogenase
VVDAAAHTVRGANERPRVAITLGDPRGIGPEIVAKALTDPRVAGRVDAVVVGPSGTDVRPDERVGAWRPGGSAADAGRLSGLAIERAVRLAQSGVVQGIVTAPIDKAALLAGGFDYPGHTEMLAELTGTRVAMMLASAKLRVVLATTHISLREVPDAVTAAAIEQAALVTHDGLRRWFGIAAPRVALCALNPHGGDGGRFGREDDDVLAPTARRLGLAGPYPADTVFVRAMRGQFDAVIAPYHDVGMTAIKVASFGSAVNVTLGLPFPRTSPDHGTALDIAGRGVADPSSFVEAVTLCVEILMRTAGLPRPAPDGRAAAHITPRVPPLITDP